MKNPISLLLWSLLFFSSCNTSCESEYFIGYNPDTGDKQEEGMLLNGEKTGVWIFYDLGRVAKFRTYEKGKLNGNSVDFLVDEEIVSNAFYVNDKLDGNAYYYQGVQRIEKYSQDTLVEAFLLHNRNDSVSFLLPINPIPKDDTQE